MHLAFDYGFERHFDLVFGFIIQLCFIVCKLEKQEQTAHDAWLIFVKQHLVNQQVEASLFYKPDQDLAQLDVLLTDLEVGRRIRL